MNSIAEIKARLINTTRGPLDPDAQNYDDIAFLLAENERLEKLNKHTEAELERCREFSHSL